MKEKGEREGEEGKKEEEIEGKREGKPPQQTCYLFFQITDFLKLCQEA